MKCTLPYDARSAYECEIGNCETCGWRAVETERRQRLIEERGLTRDTESGLWYLDIRPGFKLVDEKKANAKQ